LKLKTWIAILLISAFAFAQKDDEGGGDDGSTTDPKIQWALDNGITIPDGPRSIVGSTLVLDSVNAVGNNVDLVFLGTNNSGTTEWWDQLTIYLPAGWTINTIGVADAIPGSLNETPATSGVGTNVATWSDSGYPCSGFGFLESTDNQAFFTINANFPVGGMVDFAFTIEGDNWQDGTESVICSTTSPCTFDACLLNQTVSTVADISAQVGAPSQIPTLSQWGLIAFLALLAGAALVMMRRQRAA